MSLETHIIVALSLILLIVALSLTLLILLFVMWKDRRERRENEERLIQETLGTLQTEISRLKNLVASLQANQRNVLAEIVRQEINVLADIARQCDALQAEIVRLEGVRRGLAGDRIPIAYIPIDFQSSPPELLKDNPYWRKLSHWIRNEKQWTCEKCGINLEERQFDLHAHHIWGRGFNSPQHLKVLCIACHAKEPDHEFMKAFPEYEAFLRWRDG